MWKGDPGSCTASAASSAARNGSPSVNAAVARRMHVREVEHGPHPAGSLRDLEHVVQRAEVADAAHHLDSERDGALLPLEPLPQLPELLDDGVECVFA